MSEQNQDQNTEALPETDSVEQTSVQNTANPINESTSDSDIKVEEPKVAEKVDTKAETKSSNSSKSKEKTTINTNWLFVVMSILVLTSLFQFRQIDSLQKDNIWLNQELSNLKKATENTGPKFAVLSFEDTVAAWNEYDPSGKAIASVLQTTISQYNKQGYTIIDAKSIIGSAGHLEFIDISPERYSKESN